MQVVILAAGYSTRLYPVTQYFPKALLPVGQHAVIDCILKLLLRDFPEADFSLITNQRYLPLFRSWLDAFYPDSLNLLSNGSASPENRAGAVGDLRLVLEKVGIEDDVLVCASDTLASLNFKDFYQSFKRKNTITIAAYDTKSEARIKERLGCIEARDSIVLSFEEKPLKPRSTLASVPFYFFPRDSLADIKILAQNLTNTDAPGQLILELLAQGIPINVFEFQGFYYDVGTIDDYNALCSDEILIKRLRQTFK